MTDTASPTGAAGDGLQSAPAVKELQRKASGFTGSGSRLLAAVAGFFTRARHTRSGVYLPLVRVDRD